MLKCESIQSQISAYLDREMPLWKLQLIRWHLKQCPNCAHEALRIQQTDKILRQLDPVKASDSFLPEVMRQVSTICEDEKRQIPLMRRILRRLESSVAWTSYRFRTRTRPYAAAAALFVVMTIASAATLYHPRRPLLPLDNTPMLAQSKTNKSVVLVEFEIVSIDQFPKPHLTLDRQASSRTNP